MNRIKKSIIVRFFSIESNEDFFNDFMSNYIANKDNEHSSRIFNLKTKKHLIKISQEYDILGTVAYAVSVVRERNTWQTKATSDGKITGISLNQGIIGDPYYFFVIPSHKILLGFTSGPSDSLKSVGKSMLEQFQNDRLEKIKLNLIPREKEFSTLKNLPESGSLFFKLNASAFSDISSDAPQLIKDLSISPYLESNTQLALGLEFSDSPDQPLSKDGIIEIVDYLSDHDGCKTLKVKWLDSEGTSTQLEFVNAFLNYKTEITTRNKFIDETASIDILSRGMSDYFETVSK